MESEIIGKNLQILFGLGLFESMMARLRQHSFKKTVINVKLLLK